MSVTFTKLFSSITESTIWCEDAEIRIVWITMLAMADRHGRVWGSIPGLANRARVSIEKTESALSKFLSPDQYSRTKDFEGRRIEIIDGGWRLLNHDKYRRIRDDEERREYKKQWIANKRNELVDNVDKSRPLYTQAEAEAYTDTELTTTSLPLGLSLETWSAFKEHRKAIKAKMTPKAEKMLLAKLERIKANGFDIEEIVCTSIENGWRGVFATRLNKTRERIDNSAPARVRRANAERIPKPFIHGKSEPGK